MDTRKDTPATGNSTPSRLLAAVIAAGVFMLGTGLGYRVVAARLSAPVDATPIPASAVERFPLTIGAWTGAESTVDPNLIAATETDAHISRRYWRGNGLEAISLWVACGVRTRDLMPHRPEVCYTGSGWTLRHRQVVDLELPGGGPLPCNVLCFSRGGLSSQNTVVLYYYLVDGRYCRDVSEWRYNLKGIGYVAQVQVVTAVAPGQTAEAAQRLVSAFAADSATEIVALFDNTQNISNPESVVAPSEGE